ncbi:putative tyrosinase central domain-containing protein [Lyophyllum shimeji]|uniref:Tyrosinase central domain-containing protein n=1 Tax=Lyophyllum shimeji TaxID=47721 RepID=A0A9P3PVH5_LYOSH|nr:putative tyrosinase central domain-containing protein [Lyophyllum shimeji]
MISFSRAFVLSAAAITQARAACTNPSARVSWTTLTAAQKQAYFAADLCLMNAPAQLGAAIPGVISRYDDLVGVHQQQGNVLAGTDTWHVTGQFLSVHRYFLHAHEVLLRTECGYTGPIPYWDEVVDSGAFSSSSVVADFGGVGDTNGNIVSGPFANHVCHLGPQGNTTDHVLQRAINEGEASRCSSFNLNTALSKTAFNAFQGWIYDSIHRGGHAGIGGDMFDLMTSPNDPLFFLHHAYLDKIWADWQAVDPAKRTYDLANAGYETQAVPPGGRVPTNNNTVLYIYGILPNSTVAEVANTKGGYLCYTYQ